MTTKPKTLAQRVTALERRLARRERRKAPIGFHLDLRGSGVGEGPETRAVDEEEYDGETDD